MNTDSNQILLEKANVLIEALPYIQRFHGAIMIVKYGGSAMVDEQLKKNVIQDVALLKLVGFKPIIVHGGGKAISSMTKRLGMETKFVNGLRVTDQETMDVAEMVLNHVNKNLVSLLEKTGVKAVGISGKDGTILKAEKKYSGSADIGFVGQVKAVDTALLRTLLDKDFVPVVCPVGSDDAFHSYNINADDAACAIAKAMKASKLAFLSDIEGVYMDPDDPSTLVRRMTIQQARNFVAAGHAGGGMLPKLNSCIDAVESGVRRVHILDGRTPHSLLLEFFTNRGIGTVIVADGEENYYNGQ